MTILLFPYVCPLMPSCNTYHLTCVSLTLDVGYLFTAAPAKCSCCSLPWTGYLLTAAPPDLECGVAVLGPIRRFLVIKGLRFSAPTPKAQCLLWHCIVSLSFISCLSETQHSMEFRITLPQSNSLLFKQNTLQFSDITFPLLFTVRVMHCKSLFLSAWASRTSSSFQPVLICLFFCFYFFFFFHIYLRLHHIYLCQSYLLHLVKDPLDLLTLSQMVRL